jgi:hypothetical protein
MAQPSPVQLGALAALGSLVVAAGATLISVVTEDSAAASVGQSVTIAFAVFATGAAIVCALACLARGALELISLVAVVVAGVGLDLIAVGVWLDVDSDTYGKIAGTTLVWALVLFLVLSLVLAAGPLGRWSRPLFVGSSAAFAVVGILSTDLIFRGEEAIDNPLGTLSDDVSGVELRVLGAAAILGASCWLGTLAAERLER